MGIRSIVELMIWFAAGGAITHLGAKVYIHHHLKHEAIDGSNAGAAQFVSWFVSGMVGISGAIAGLVVGLVVKFAS